MKWTLVYRFYKSLTLAHLERSLYSISRQTVKPDQMVFFDNNSMFSEEEIMRVVAQHFKIEDWTFYFARHHDQKKTLSWSNNRAIALSDNDHFILARADFIYTFDCFERWFAVYDANLPAFVSSWIYWMGYYADVNDGTVDHASDLEPLNWREDPKRLLSHRKDAIETKFSEHDGPSFLTSKRAMDLCGWYDEALYGWGFDQQDMQQKMIEAGVSMRVIPEFMLFHILHQVAKFDRDLEKALKIWLSSPRQAPGILAEERRIKEEHEDRACNAVQRFLRRCRRSFVQHRQKLCDKAWLQLDRLQKYRRPLSRVGKVTHHG
jgi:hypothetical protein